jgi:hypothetical protein
MLGLCNHVAQLQHQKNNHLQDGGNYQQLDKGNIEHSFTTGKSNKFFFCFLEFNFLSGWVSPKQTLNWKWAKSL